MPNPSLFLNLSACSQERINIIVLQNQVHAMQYATLIALAIGFIIGLLAMHRYMVKKYGDKK